MNSRGRLKKRLTGYSFSRKELYALDVTLAKFCAEGIRQFIKIKRHGTPVGLSEEEWEKALQAIHWSLNSVAIDYKNEPTYQNVTKDIKPATSIDADKEYQERVLHGLKLFGRYFCDLWD